MIYPKSELALSYAMKCKIFDQNPLENIPLMLKLSKMETIKHRIGLSGTPIYNRGSEIWPIIDILKPGMLGNYREFCEYFCYLNEKGKAIVLENKRESLRLSDTTGLHVSAERTPSRTCHTPTGIEYSGRISRRTIDPACILRS